MFGAMTFLKIEAKSRIVKVCAMQTLADLADNDEALRLPVIGKLREIVRLPIFYFRHWGIADFDREDSPIKLFSDMESITTVNQIISRETAVDGPHILWQQHLVDMADPEVQREIALHSQAPQEPLRRPIHRLPNDNWVSSPLAAIICHNVIDLVSEASTLLWHPMVRWIQ